MLHVHNNHHTHRYSDKWLQVVNALELACEDLPKLSDVCPEMHLKLDQRSAASPASLPSPDTAAATLSARRTPRSSAKTTGEMTAVTSGSRPLIPESRLYELLNQRRDRFGRRLMDYVYVYGIF